MGVEVREVRRHVEVVCGDDFPIGHEARVGVEFDAVFEKASEAFEDAALEIGVEFFLENIVHARDAEREADHLVGVDREVVHQPVELAVIRDQHRSSQRAQHVHAVQKIPEVEMPGREQVFHGDFHEDFGVRTLNLLLFLKHLERAVEHVVRDMRDGPEAAALDEQGLFIKGVRRLHDLAVRTEQCRFREALNDKLQIHDPVVDTRERRAGKTDHIHKNPSGREVVHE